MKRPSPTVAIAILALLITFSGIASALPGKNTVDSGDVKKDALKGKDIKESTLNLPPGAVAEGLKVSTRLKVLSPVSAFSFGAGTMNCPAGKQAIAGGGGYSDGSTDGRISSSFPVKGENTPPGDGDTFDGWRIGVFDDGEDPITPVVYVVCVG